VIAKCLKFLLDIIVLLFISLVIIAILIAGVLYAPFKFSSDLRDLYIETAMTTFSHQWLAQAFFDPKFIEQVMKHNIAPELNQNTAPGGINVVAQNSIEIKDISGPNFAGKLMIVRNPAKVKISVTDTLLRRGEKIETLVQKVNAIGGINGSGFIDYQGRSVGGTPVGIIIKDGKFVYYPGGRGLISIAGFNKDNVLIVGRYTLSQIKTLNLRDAVSPFYILTVNGVDRIKGGTGGYGVQPRTAIGQTKDGTVLLLVIDGRQVHSIGATMKQVQDIMTQNGSINTVSLDGGSSTTMYYDGKIINKPSTKSSAKGRWLPSAFIVER
jgi:exopolysaccharide biosynthesis protein